MPEEVIADVKTSDRPEPSTGTTLTPPSDPEAYSEWRLTGKVPEQKHKPKQEAPAASARANADSAEGESAEETESPEETSAPEAGKRRQEHRKGSAADRLNEVLADLKRAGLSPSELKTFRKQAQAQPLPQPAETRPTPPPPQQPQRLTEPKLEDYRTWEDFQNAQRAFNSQMVDDRIREAWSQIQMQQSQEYANRQAAERIENARQRYGEEAEGSIVLAARSVFGDQNVHPAIKGIVNESPVIADLLYVLGSQEAELQQFIQTAHTNPGEAIRRLITVENFVKEELQKASKTSSNGAQANGKEPERDESGRFLPVKKEAPPPAREVSGRASLPGSETDAAFQRGDVRAYMNAANRRDLAARKGR